MEPRYPDITVPLSGEDGNIFFIIGRTRRLMNRAGLPREEMDAFSKEVMDAESYDKALQTVMKWVHTE